MELFRYENFFIRYYSEIFWKQDTTALLKMLEGFSGTVVELGPADGRVLSLLAESGFPGIGIEQIQDFVTIARNKVAASRQNEKISFVHGDFLSFENYPDPCAVILWSNTASTLTKSEREQLFRTLARKLSPGSRFLLWNATEVPVAYALPERCIPTAEGELKVSNRCTEDFDQGRRTIFYDLEVNGKKERSGGDTFIVPAKTLLSELTYAGLKICKLYGNLDLSPWEEGKSPFIIVHAEPGW